MYVKTVSFLRGLIMKKKKNEDLSFLDDDKDKKNTDPLSELKLKGKNKDEKITEIVEAIRYILLEDKE
jgi:hypothetical protein